MEPAVILIAIIIGAVFFVLFNRGGDSNNTTPLSSKSSFSRIADNYKTVAAVQDALEKAGLEASNLIIGIDYTKSNETKGRRTFGGKSLHHISVDSYNPYQRVISILGRTLEKFDEDRLIPVFGFGDTTTKDHSVFPFYPDETPRYCNGFEEVLRVYNRITPLITLSGPTNFAPIINKAIDIVTERGRKEYHILVIIADGEVINEQETIDAIVRASNYPLSIIVIGVGDGPFGQMEHYDDKLPQRKFDNFQFVNFDEVMRKSKGSDAAFALAALQEIPQQYSAIRKLGLI
eukprot:GEZU01025153.1.p1 GENE.GEZU01025153.1~~GEZU01025153.1.p1  ORF type:complete len:290 (+),score=50.24 GEZU01025153.1:36-905(+)